MSEPSNPSDDLSPREAQGPLLRWVWRAYLRHEKWPVLFAVLLMALEGSMLGALSWIVQPMFDTVFIEGNRSAIYWVAGAIAMIFVIRAVSAFGHKVLMQGAGLRLTARMQSDMVAHILTLDGAYFHENPPGTLIERVRGDTAQVQTIWSAVLATFGRDVISLIALLAVALSIDVVWTFVAIAGVPLLLGPVLILQRYVRKRSLRSREAAAHLSTRLDEIFHGINTVKLNTSEALQKTLFAGTLDRFLTQEMKSRVGRAGIPALTDFVAAAGFAGVVIYGGNQIIDGDKTVGEFMSFFTAMGLMFEPVRRVANVSGIWQVVRASLERVQAVFRERPHITSPAVPAALPVAPGEADIVFDDVVVRYGSESALEGASFVARAGETTALVGASGAGKSTVFNVLTRLVDPQSGEIRVGDTPIDRMSLADLRSIFAVVTQEAPMFDESLRDNIVLAMGDVEQAQIDTAVASAHLTDVVARFEKGLDTPAGPRGSALSGGQKQRVAIARALLRDAPILLLDEATSALDAESEKHVQAALDELSEGRTTLVIAHRLSTIRRADKIVVMDAGRVVDEGRHEDLIERGGLYARLHALQFPED